MVQRPCPDLRGGCAAMRIPTATEGRGSVNDPSYPAGTRGDAEGRMLDSLRLRYEDGLEKKVVGRF